MATNTSGNDQKLKTNYIQVVLSGNQDLPVKQVVFYPNPAKGVMNVMGINTITSATIQSLDGKLVHVAFEGNQIDLSDVSAGIYFATVKDESGRVYQTKRVRIGYRTKNKTRPRQQFPTFPIFTNKY